MAAIPGISVLLVELEITSKHMCIDFGNEFAIIGA